MKEDKPKNKAKPKKKVGRKEIDYNKVVLKNLDKIEEALSNGATEKDVYQMLKISYNTWNKFKKKKELKRAVKNANEIVIDNIKGAMYKRALGYKVEEVATTTSSTEGTTVVMKEKFIYSDTSAIALLKLKDKKSLDVLNNNSIKREEMKMKNKEDVKTTDKIIDLFTKINGDLNE